MFHNNLLIVRIENVFIMNIFTKQLIKLKNVLYTSIIIKTCIKLQFICIWIKKKNLHNKLITHFVYTYRYKYKLKINNV